MPRTSTTATTPKRRSARKTKATPKKKQAQASKTTKGQKVKITESPEKIVFETPPKNIETYDASNNKRDDVKPRTLFDSDADDDDYMVSDDELVEQHVLRKLTDAEKEPKPGRVYFVCKGIDYHLSDDVSLITKAAVLWFNETDTDESIIDSDGVYVSCADNFSLAMAEVRERGALHMISSLEPIDDASIPSPDVSSPVQMERVTLSSPSSKFACMPKHIAPAIRHASPNSSVEVKKEIDNNSVFSAAPVDSATTVLAKHSPKKAALVTPNPYNKAAKNIVKAAKPKKKFDLRNATIDVSMVQEMVDQQAKLKQQAADGGPNHIFHVSGTGIHVKDGRIGATGIIDLVNANNKQYWTYKPAAIPVAFTAACFSVEELSHLRQFAETLHTVVCRRHPHGKSVPKKTPANAQGRSYNIEAVAFYVDLTPFVQGVSLEEVESCATEKLAELIGDVHQVFISTLFKQALEKSMETNPRTEQFFKKTVCKDSNLTELHSTIRQSKLKIDMPAPLSKFLLDEDIVAAMQTITFTDSPSDWTEEERKLAYKDGNIPDDVEGGDEEITID